MGRALLQVCVAGIVAVGCGAGCGESDDHSDDSGPVTVDAGSPDGTVIADASLPDAAAPDAAIPDAAPPDSAALDAGGCEPAPTDADSDGISDEDEGSATSHDTDADGTPDYMDADSDNDGILDSVEAGDGDLCTEPIDFDADGTPDFRDIDTDNDSVPDQLEGVSDPDGDLLPAYQDVDADGDCIPDAIEVGTDPLSPTDADGDGTFDFLDTDSDNDGLSDGAEDLDCDGNLDAGETSPVLADTDVDGVPDDVELAAGTDPRDPASGLDPADFYIVLPYLDPEKQIDFDFQLHKADVQLSVDTTGSMGGTVTELQSSLAAMVSAMLVEIPDLGLGVSSFEDFPVLPFGALNTHPEEPAFPHDMPFRLYQRITTNFSTMAAGVGALELGHGGDGPDSGIEAMYQIATGDGITWTVTTAGSVPPFDPLAGFDELLGHGTRGGVGFRDGALPVVMHVTDIEWHDSTDYVFAGITDAHSRDEAVVAMTNLGARFIGVTSSSAARTQLEGIARDTGAVVPPEAWGTTETMCHTDRDGGLLPPDASGLCPLVFGMTFGGTGVSTAMIDGFEALVNFATIDYSAVPVADPDLLPGMDTSVFITGITPVPPAPPGATIIGNVFKDVRFDSAVTFRARARNTTVAHEVDAQLFKVTLRVVGDGSLPLDEYRVLIVVPAL